MLFFIICVFYRNDGEDGFHDFPSKYLWNPIRADVIQFNSVTRFKYFDAIRNKYVDRHVRPFICVATKSKKIQNFAF